MSRNIFYRDFTLSRAMALVVLIGLAAVLGEVPHADGDLGGADLSPAGDPRLVPAQVLRQDALDDQAKGAGIAL